MNEYLKGHTGRAVDQTASRKPLTVKAWVRSRASPVAFVMDKVARGPLFVPVLWFCPFNITPMFHTHLNLIRGTSGRSLGTSKASNTLSDINDQCKEYSSICKALGKEMIGKWHTHTHTHTHTHKPVCQHKDVTVSWDRGVHTEK